MGPLIVERCIPIHVVTPVIVKPKFKHEDKTKKTRALPESHNVTISNLFGCTAPRFGVLTSNAPDADLPPSPESARLVSTFHDRSCGDRTYDRETSAPYQNERKGQYESYFCGNVFLQEIEGELKGSFIVE
jgi:hypothetical protein